MVDDGLREAVEGTCGCRARASSGRAGESGLTSPEAEPGGWGEIAAAWLIVAACLVCLWLA